VIKTVSFEVIDLGKLMKKSKKKFAWKFSIDGIPNHIELIVSYYSGKKVIIHNGVNIYEGKKKMDSHFSFPFQIEVNMCSITQNGDHYELKINNQSFDQLYEQQIKNPIRETQTQPKAAVRIDPSHDPRARTTQVLLEAEGAKPGFQDALTKLKGARPALENQQKNPPAKPAQQQQPQAGKNNANSMNLMDYQFDFGGANQNANNTGNQGFGNINQGFGNMNQGNQGNQGFGNIQPNNNNANNLGNLDWLSDMNKPTGNNQSQANANTFGQFEMRGNQPKLTNQYIQASNYKQDEFSSFNDFSGFGNFGGNNPQGGNANANNNFGNFGNFGGNQNQNANSPNLAQQTISLGFDNKPIIQQNPQPHPAQNAKKDKELQKERERQEREAQKERERLEKEKKQAKKAAKDLAMKDKQPSPPVNNADSGFGSQNPPQNNTSPPAQQTTVPTVKKPTLSQLIGLDTSKLSGLAGTTKKSRAAEEAAQAHEVENQQNYANTNNYDNNNYGGGYDNNNYGGGYDNNNYANNQNYGNNNYNNQQNYGYSHNY